MSCYIWECIYFSKVCLVKDPIHWDTGSIIFNTLKLLSSLRTCFSEAASVLYSRSFVGHLLTLRLGPHVHCSFIQRCSFRVV